MKPKLFVGSSVEGLNIAYAVHQNLQYQAEVTVWDQGVFNLSRSALDSLLKVLENSDFGVFIFSPDDMVKMHGKESRTVRDNVLFELGLFIGKLGQDRSFILTPRDHTDLHLPTDLIGITPGTYETDRIDGSFQAATGPACNEIRKAINLLGFISKVSNLPSAPQSDDRSTQLEEKALEISSKNNEHSEDKDSITEKKSSKDEFGWLDSYLEQDYEKAISLLEEKLEGTDELRLRSYYKSWIGRSLAKKDFETGIQYLNDLKEEFPESVHPYNGIAQVYIDNQLFEEAISVYDLGLTIVQDKYWLTVEKSQGLDEMGYS
ncbi:MAG TPA: TIR domain-containing protein, partial [Pyrinomonadaceae bacterium]